MNDIQAEQLSPLLHLPARMPPHVVAYGTGETEEFIRQSVDYVAACQALGYPVTALALPANHFDILDHLADGNGALARAACALLGVASPQPGPSA
jgi:arylformamidase